MALILVVDDCEIFRRSISKILKLRGHTPVCASNGREALTSISVRRPDLVLLDVKMPEMDGLAFLRAFRKESQCHDVPIILLTSVTERAQLMTADSFGAWEHLRKGDISSEDLLNRVERQLSWRAMSRVGGRYAARPDDHPSVGAAA